jgi:hypothetical protein
MQKEKVVVAYFKVLSQNLSGEIYENLNNINIKLREMG